MATLEVHDGEGRVQFVELARDHPLIFGTSVACDIVLSGEGISPVQGRIRWKKGRYRVEASPDAEFVVINGHKMTSSSLNQGDEMTVGRCRLFMLRLDETLEAKPATRSAKRSDEERTQVLDGPTHLHTGPARGGRLREESPHPGGEASRRCLPSPLLNATTGWLCWAWNPIRKARLRTTGSRASRGGVELRAGRPGQRAGASLPPVLWAGCGIGFWQCETSVQGLPVASESYLPLWSRAWFLLSGCCYFWGWG